MMVMYADDGARRRSGRRRADRVAANAGWDGGMTGRVVRAAQGRMLAWIGDWIAGQANDPGGAAPAADVAGLRGEVARVLVALDGDDGDAVARIEEHLLYGHLDLWRGPGDARRADDMATREPDGVRVAGEGLVVCVFRDGMTALLAEGLGVDLGRYAAGGVLHAYRGERAVPLSASVLPGDRISYGARPGQTDTGEWEMLAWGGRALTRDELQAPVPLSQAARDPERAATPDRGRGRRHRAPARRRGL